MKVRTKLEELIESTLNLAPGSYSLSQELTESDIDSFSLYNLVFAVEDAFLITLPDEGLDGIKTLEGLEALILERVALKAQTQN